VRPRFRQPAIGLEQRGSLVLTAQSLMRPGLLAKTLEPDEHLSREFRRIQTPARRPPRGRATSTLFISAPVRGSYRRMNSPVPPAASAVPCGENRR